MQDPSDKPPTPVLVARDPRAPLPAHGLGTPPAEEADEADVRTAIQLLEWLDADQARVMALDDELRKRLLMAAGKVARPGRDDRKRRVKEERRARRRDKRDADEAQLNATGIRRKRDEPVYVTPRAPAMLMGSAVGALPDPDAAPAFPPDGPDAEAAAADPLRSVALISAVAADGNGSRATTALHGTQPPYLVEISRH